MAPWRLFLFAGLFSVLIGILYITSFLEDKSKGFTTWGYLLLFWGIAVILVSLNRFGIASLIKGIAAIGIFLHGSVSFYWLLFPNSPETSAIEHTIILFLIPQVLIALFCLYILGIKLEKKYDKIN
ncbi:hypothetical protein [Fictibacillus barbaricus]|uniref:Uncharacterized membrane protein HdeD (DUF308 family) n=1 Tax=Fictibacillus barbaricus TaxID=182136 RepID=A0ABU1TXK4_9BACL|nr:hypothetical protein [Fictibacillus barbaricus]MDR7071918.1 uncharacterized membrane protein HdeD (DUF308 family) [Fictibacillus barbaricus]